MKILAINGSYRRGGMIDQAVEAAVSAARAGGAEVELARLGDKNIKYCDNCRACMQKPGEGRGPCHIADDMAALLDAADRADGYILGAPVNCFNLNAMTRAFLERLGPYAYWPWGAKGPVMRRKAGAKRAVLIVSSAMPSLFGRLLTGGLRAQRFAAAAFGARVAGTLFIGMSSMQPKPALTPGDRRRAEALGRKLL